VLQGEVGSSSAVGVERSDSFLSGGGLLRACPPYAQRASRASPTPLLRHHPASIQPTMALLEDLRTHARSDGPVDELDCPTQLQGRNNR
jgi:hypothetical protein